MKIIKTIFNKVPLILLMMSLFSCRTADTGIEETSGQEEYYLSRPKFTIESPVSRLPYTLKWEENRRVRSYDVQMALDSQFTEARRHWTTREPQLLLQELPAETTYLRVRSHLNGDYSRWSESLELVEEGGQLKINRVRN